MSRFTGSSWKVSRRLGYSISETEKELIKRKYAPGQHGAKRAKKNEDKSMHFPKKCFCHFQNGHGCFLLSAKCTL